MATRGVDVACGKLGIPTKAQEIQRMPSNLFDWLDRGFDPASIFVCNIEGEGDVDPPSGGDGASSGGDDGAPDDDARMNAIATNHIKRAVTGLSKKTQEMVSEALAPVLNQMAEMSEVVRLLKEPPDDSSSKGKGKDPGTAAFEAELKKRDKELADLRTAVDSAEAEKQAVIDKEQETEKATLVSEALGKHGLTGIKAAATAALLEKQGRVRRDDAGNVLFVIPGSGYLGEDEFLELDDGIGGWLKDDGKDLAPARGSQGSGGSNVRTQAKPTGDRSRAVVLNWALGKVGR